MSDDAAHARSGVVRPVLWVLLVLCAAGDVIAAQAGAAVVVRAPLGLATLACAAALIVQHYRNRPC
ncbi:hypothetical protein OHR68_34050 [Spirillospora sp. NBC_00431]